MALAILLACGPGCHRPSSKDSSKDKEESATSKSEEQGVPVEVAQLKRGPIEEILTASNHLEAEQEVQVHARTSNLVKELLVEEGDIVDKDQVLLRLEDTDQRLNYKKALSQLRQAELKFARTEGLYKEELVSQQEYDDEKIRLEQLQLSLEEAERQVEFTEIRAPISGTITTRLVNLGDQVNTSQHLFTLVDFDSIVARVYVPESALLSLKLDQPVRILAKSLEGRVFAGFIKRIAPVVDKESGTIKVTVGVRDRGNLLPGMFVDAELVVASHPQALLIPKRAIVYGGELMYVYKLTSEKRVQRVQLRPLLSDRDFVEPAEGFEVGDEIVIAGQTGLRDHALVEVQEGNEPDASGEISKTPSE